MKWLDKWDKLSKLTDTVKNIVVKKSIYDKLVNKVKIHWFRQRKSRKKRIEDV